LPICNSSSPQSEELRAQKKRTRERVGYAWKSKSPRSTRIYFEGGPLVPFDEAAGGHGVLPGDVLVLGVVELFWLLPDVEGDEPEFDEPLLDELEFDESGLGVDPVLGVVAPAVPVVPGRFPHGELLGVLPGVVFGFVVEGCVVLPGVGGLVEFAPGTGDGVVGTGDGVVGVEVLPGGVAEFPDGVVVPGV
jgi:hypothetical protein